MNKQNAFYLSVASITMLALVVFSATTVRALWYAPDPQVSPPSTVDTYQDIVSTDYPTRLIIPALSIDANVQRVGLNAAGRMATPSNFTDVAWYRYGTMPGQKGSAVIAGHVNNGLGLDGVFKNLTQLQVGDTLQIRTKGGKIVSFVVSDIKSYPYDQVPAETLFNVKDAARLNLITCEGNWVKGEKTYDHRLVIFAIRT